MALNHKLQTVVDVWDGDYSKCAAMAGITEQYARRLLMDPISKGIQPKCLEVQHAIKQRQAIEIRPKVLSRIQRQEWWTKQVTSTANTMSDRLRASELLGKSEADFVDVIKAEHTMRLQLGAPRRAVDSRTLPDAPLEPAQDDRPVEATTDDKADMVV